MITAKELYDIPINKNISKQVNKELKRIEKRMIRARRCGEKTVDIYMGYWTDVIKDTIIKELEEKGYYIPFIGNNIHVHYMTIQVVPL